MRTILAIIFMTFATQASAQEPFNTNNMSAWYPFCKTYSDGRATSDLELMAGAFCMGAVRATQQTGSLFCNIDEANTGIGIDATYASNQTLMLVVLNFYEQNAQWLDIQTLSTVAFFAMTDAYPCE